MNNPIDINPEFRRALDLLEHTSQNVFITGKAGTGKSTLLEYFRKITAKNIVVLAPTGVAAVNVEGETVHSFFRFKANVTMDKVSKIKSAKRRKLYSSLDMIIVDEASMLRADLLDCVDKFLRLNGKREDRPFGGAQVVFVGDLYQLPPVVMSEERDVFSGYYRSSYFFDSKVFNGLEIEFVELKKIYRQRDEGFIRILNAVSDNTVLDEHLKALNRRWEPDADIEGHDYCVYLAPTNALAGNINERMLEKLTGPANTFSAEIEGEVNEKWLPVDKELRLKQGAQVMLLNNDEKGRWVNGTVGKITAIVSTRPYEAVEVTLENGETVTVFPHKWEVFRFALNEDNGVLEARPAGKFMQYPLKLAWAITIHKSQGKTFDKVIIDTGNGMFACGQLYVALSRCRTLEGIILKKPLRREHIITDHRAAEFLASCQ